MLKINLVEELLIDPEMNDDEIAEFLNDHGIVDEFIPIHTIARDTLVANGLVSEYCRICRKFGEEIFNLEQLVVDEINERVSNHSAHVETFYRSQMGFRF